MKTYRVLLVEDRMIHKSYFECLLQASGRYLLVGTETNMEDAVQFCGHTLVDLILTDAVDREGQTCFVALAECKRKYSLRKLKSSLRNFPRGQGQAPTPWKQIPYRLRGL